MEMEIRAKLKRGRVKSFTGNPFPKKKKKKKTGNTLKNPSLPRHPDQKSFQRWDRSKQWEKATERDLCTSVFPDPPESRPGDGT